MKPNEPTPPPWHVGQCLRIEAADGRCVAQADNDADAEMIVLALNVLPAILRLADRLASAIETIGRWQTPEALEIARELRGDMASVCGEGT